MAFSALPITYRFNGAGRRHSFVTFRSASCIVVPWSALARKRLIAYVGVKVLRPSPNGKSQGACGLDAMMLVEEERRRDSIVVSR